MTSSQRCSWRFKTIWILNYIFSIWQFEYDQCVCVTYPLSLLSVHKHFMSPKGLRFFVCSLVAVSVVYVPLNSHLQSFCLFCTSFIAHVSCKTQFVFIFKLHFFCTAPRLRLNGTR
jgi:hypothetical protein